MQIFINGEKLGLENSISVEKLLLSREHDIAQVAVELNGKIIRRASLSETLLNDGDVLEVVTLVGGG